MDFCIAILDYLVPLVTVSRYGRTPCVYSGEDISSLSLSVFLCTHTYPLFAHAIPRPSLSCHLLIDDI